MTGLTEHAPEPKGMTPGACRWPWAWCAVVHQTSFGL